MIDAPEASQRTFLFPVIQGDLPTVVRGEGIYLYDGVVNLSGYRR